MRVFELTQVHLTRKGNESIPRSNKKQCLSQFSTLVASRIQGQETNKEKGLAATVESNDKSFNLERTFTYRGIPEISNLDLGVLESDSEGHVKVTLVNDSADEFRVSAIEVSCSCVSATVPNEIIASGKSSLLTVKLKVPNQADAAIQTQSIVVRQNNDRAMLINLRYKMGMMCGFAKPSATVMVPFDQAKVKFNLPVLITSPLTIADVRIYGVSQKMTPYRGLPSISIYSLQASGNPLHPDRLACLVQGVGWR